METLATKPLASRSTTRADDRSRQSILKVLKSVFKFKSLRAGQEEVMLSVLNRRNTLAIMPTGAGKSLCYQIPALIMPGTTIVVSPLISLMKDQREKLEALNISALEVNSSISVQDREANVLAVKHEDHEFVYTTPEQLTHPDFIKSLRTTHVDLVVIDEAHCLSQWGHDFRPAYLNIKETLRLLDHPPVLALTATATPEVIKDIQVQLSLDSVNIINSGIRRPNLFLETFLLNKEEEKREKLVELLNEISGTVIVYASTVKTVTSLKAYLSSVGIAAASYHGKLKIGERHATQEAFMAGACRVVVATNAFGLGIDKPDVRAVIHYNFPGSLESYYQEAGRAGRDGQPARCILLYLKKDKCTQSFFLAGMYPKIEEIRAVYQFLTTDSEQSDGNEFTLKHVQTMMSEIPKRRISVILSALQEAGVIKKAKRSAYVVKRKKLNDAQLADIAQSYQNKRENDQHKLKKMITYSQSALCRWKALLTYFGHHPSQQPCRQCDNCLRGINFKAQVS